MKPASLGASLLHNASSALLGRIVGSLLGVVTFGVIARTIGAAGLGQYRTVLTLLLFTSMVFDLGLYPITLREISAAGADQARILGNAIMLRLCGTFSATVVLALIAWLAGFAPTVKHGVIIAGIGWIGYQLSELLRAVFQQKRMQLHGAIAENLGATVTLALVVAIAGIHGGTDGVLAATSVGFLCSAAATWYFANRLIPLRPRIDWLIWRSLIIAGIPMAGSILLLNIQLRVDVLLLSLLRAANEVGLYDAPVKIYELLFVIPYLLGGLMMPLFVRDLDGGRGSMAPRLSAVIGLLLVCSTLVFAVLFVFGDDVIALIAGPAFVAAAGPLHVLAGAAVFSGISAIMRFAAVALNQQARMLRADVVGVCVAVVAHCLLIPTYGVLGAALGKLCGDMATAITALLLFRQQFQKSVIESTLTAMAACGALFAGLSVADNNGAYFLLPTLIGSALIGGILLMVPRVRADLRCITAP
jgi:O-antigen/teichoic acid export membrane protein